MSKKKDTGWRKRNNPNAPNYGQAFHLEPHGHRSDLPVALRQVSINEISDALKRHDDKKKSEEELEADELIDAAVREEIEKEMELDRQKNVMKKLSDYIDDQDKKLRMKKALEEAKADVDEQESDSADGYEEFQENVEKGKKLIDENDVFG